MINILMGEDFIEWDNQILLLRERVSNLKVPNENSPVTLHNFNIETEALYTEVQLLYGRSRALKDAIARLIKNVLENAYEGRSSDLRRAAGIQYAENYPYQDRTVNLFHLDYRYSEYMYSLEAMIKSLEAKMNAKITNNSLLNLEKSLMPN